MRTNLHSQENMRHLSKYKSLRISSNTSQQSNVNIKRINKEYENINTTAKSNLCGRVSFKGVTNTIVKEAKKTKKPASKLANSFSKKISSAAKKLAKNEKFQKIVIFVNKKEILSEAIFAALLTCTLRPLFILGLDRKKESREKNKYAAIHSIASGILGVGFSIAYNEPIRKIISAGIDKSKNLNSKIAKDGTADNIQNLFKRATNTMSMPLKATLTIAFIPVLLKLFGVSKPDKNKSNVSAQQDAQGTNFKALYPQMVNSESKVFKEVIGDITYENK